MGRIMVLCLKELGGGERKGNGPFLPRNVMGIDQKCWFGTPSTVHAIHVGNMHPSIMGNL